MAAPDQPGLACCSCRGGAGGGHGRALLLRVAAGRESGGRSARTVVRAPGQLDPSFHDRSRGGELVSRMTDDAAQRDQHRAVDGLRRRNGRCAG